jgi:hypothetical protein
METSAVYSSLLSRHIRLIALIWSVFAVITDLGALVHGHRGPGKRDGTCTV